MSKKITVKKNAVEEIKTVEKNKSYYPYYFINGGQVRQTLADAMKSVVVKFTAKPQSIKEGTSDLMNEFLIPEQEWLMEQGKKLSGGALLDEVIMRFYAITGKGVTMVDMENILSMANSRRSDVKGHIATFSAFEGAPRKECRKSVYRFKKDGRFCIVSCVG
jgi:hypothetical protein